MEGCLDGGVHYLDTANYEHPDVAHFEYKEQWAFDAPYHLDYAQRLARRCLIEA